MDSLDRNVTFQWVTGGLGGKFFCAPLSSENDNADLQNFVASLDPIVLIKHTLDGILSFSKELFTELSAETTVFSDAGAPAGFVLDSLPTNA